VSCFLRRHGFRSRVLRALCLFVVLLSFSCQLMKAQTAAQNVADGDASSLALATDDSSALPQQPSVGSPASESSSRPAISTAMFDGSVHPTATSPLSTKWNWKASTLQSFEFTMFNHVWRAAWDPSLRYQLAHKPFYHDWFASYGGYNLHRWGDGDDFVVNYVGHPLQGAVTSRNYLINDPRSHVQISKNRNYWVPLAWSTLWSAVWQVQWKVGPFSETSFGNAGGWEYVPGCGTDLACLHNPKYPKPPTNNTGLTDWISTPLIGDAWVLAEDTLDRFVVVPIARNHRILGGRILRACLEPSRDFAAVFAGKPVWDLPQAENNFVVQSPTFKHKVKHDKIESPLDHWEIATQYSNISLPVLSNTCSGVVCRKNLSGLGGNFDYNFTRGFAFDSTVNFIPGQQGAKPMMEGLFGVKMGERWQHWGLFGKIRPGFIYYETPCLGEATRTPPASLASPPTSVESLNSTPIATPPCASTSAQRWCATLAITPTRTCPPSTTCGRLSTSSPRVTSRSQPPTCTASRLTDCRLRCRYSHSPLRTSFGEARKRRTWQPQSGVVPLSRTQKRAALACG